MNLNDMGHKEWNQRRLTRKWNSSDIQNHALETVVSELSQETCALASEENWDSDTNTSNF